ncbi:MAG: co-chaperone GroES [Clostridiales bacterium]|nr:co-chaperone GroES [Clostridiales bacterium]
MKLRPMADNVLLKAHEAPETTASGIILATTNKEKPAIYEVVSVGPGTKDVTMTVEVGQKVVVGKFVGSDVTIDKEEYKFVKQDEILAVVTD